MQTPELTPFQTPAETVVNIIELDSESTDYNYENNRII